MFAIIFALIFPCIMIIIMIIALVVAIRKKNYNSILFFTTTLGIFTIFLLYSSFGEAKGFSRAMATGGGGAFHNTWTIFINEVTGSFNLLSIPFYFSIFYIILGLIIWIYKVLILKNNV